MVTTVGSRFSWSRLWRRWPSAQLSGSSALFWRAALIGRTTEFVGNGVLFLSVFAFVEGNIEHIGGPLRVIISARRIAFAGAHHGMTERAPDKDGCITVYILAQLTLTSVHYHQSVVDVRQQTLIVCLHYAVKETPVCDDQMFVVGASSDLSFEALLEACVSFGKLLILHEIYASFLQLLNGGLTGGNRLGNRR